MLASMPTTGGRAARRHVRQDRRPLDAIAQPTADWSGGVHEPAPVRRVRASSEVDLATVPLPPITRTMLARLPPGAGWSTPTTTGTPPEPAELCGASSGSPSTSASPSSAAVSASARVSDHTCVLLTERSARTGYRLLLDADQVDLHIFEDLIFRAAATQDAVAVDLLVQALTMWTERPLLGLPDKAFVRDNLSRLTRLRDRACRELASACRALRRTRDALTVFDHLQATHPDDVALRDLVDRLRDDAEAMLAHR
jgi:hypothetical protein